MNVKMTITIDDVIRVLNEMVEADRAAAAALIANRVPCNEKLANHPSIQVSAQHGGFHVGLLGVLNGLFGTYEDGMGPIAAFFVEVDGQNFHDLQKFGRTIRSVEEQEQERPDAR